MTHSDSIVPADAEDSAPLGHSDVMARLNLCFAAVIALVHIAALAVYGRAFPIELIAYELYLWGALVAVSQIWIRRRHGWSMWKMRHDEREQSLAGDASKVVVLTAFATSFLMVDLAMFAVHRPLLLPANIVAWAAWLMMHINIASFSIARILAARYR